MSRPTCFLDVGAVFCVAGFWAEAHQVDGKGTEDVLITHDEVGHNAVGSPVLFIDCEPLLDRNHTKNQFNIHYICWYCMCLICTHN